MPMPVEPVPALTSDPVYPAILFPVLKDSKCLIWWQKIPSAWWYRGRNGTQEVHGLAPGALSLFLLDTAHLSPKKTYTHRLALTN